MRYKVEASYEGTNYCGWQSQLNAVSVQQTIEKCLAIKLREEIQITGCCRTDAGVHALKTYFHFDFGQKLPADFEHALNNLLPFDISINEVSEVSSNFHARFDALERAYIYKIHVSKDPFKKGKSFYFPQLTKIDFGVMEDVARIIGLNAEFAPFCKTMTDAKTRKCHIFHADWTVIADAGQFEFRIRSDRFLRGMVRLIVGACLQIGQGKMSLSELDDSLKTQKPLSKPWSVPAEGLYLSDVVYP